MRSSAVHTYSPDSPCLRTWLSLRVCVCRYNFLLYVPYQLERIMIFGTLLCLYSFLVGARCPADVGRFLSCCLWTVFTIVLQCYGMCSCYGLIPA
jgi:hypothetical protein